MPTTGAKSIQVKSTTAATYLIRTAGMSSYFLTTHQSSPYATREFTTSSTVWYYLADTSSNPDNLSATGAWNFPTTAGNLALYDIYVFDFAGNQEWYFRFTSMTGTNYVSNFYSIDQLHYAGFN